MAKIVTPIVCKVVAIGRPKESTFAPGQYYQPVLFVDTSYPEGDEQAKLWKNLTPQEVEQLRKGDTVQLVPIGADKQGNPKHQIVKVNPQADRLNSSHSFAAQPTNSAQRAIADYEKRKIQPSMSDQDKREVANQIAIHAAVMRFCLETARAQFSDFVQSEESIRTLATTLFLSVTR